MKIFTKDQCHLQFSFSFALFSFYYHPHFKNDKHYVAPSTWEPVGISQLPHFGSKPLFLDVKLMGKLRPSVMNQFG